MRGAELTDEPCSRPADFDLAAYWAQSSAQFQANLPRYPAVLRVDPAILPRMRSEGRYARIEHEAPPDDQGWVRLEMLFEEQHSACEYVLSYATRIEVLEPAALRELVIRAAEGIAAMYALAKPALNEA
jgi:predicted DNA-binding transcriptional regulator YafY